MRHRAERGLLSLGLPPWWLNGQARVYVAPGGRILVLGLVGFQALDDFPGN